MSKKIRIELRFDEEKDKEMIEFIDEYGSTRAGFIKQVLKVYKNQVDGSSPSKISTIQKQGRTENVHPEVQRTYTKNKKNKKRKPSAINDISFSSKDLSE